ncbi:hypothetical protein DPMN_007678 [Dreissena polymorpha]|uniref:Uncharacterized protein n=1 Tax=Dreissena polymorpha TaxID=45954 RepID=A0A9D4RYX5_DREPO|nr:hypothetical protein DPMN_007678 [Dreissena polymorpha]
MWAGFASIQLNNNNRGRDLPPDRRHGGCGVRSSRSCLRRRGRGFDDLDERVDGPRVADCGGVDEVGNPGVSVCR